MFEYVSAQTTTGNGRVFRYVQHMRRHPPYENATCGTHTPGAPPPPLPHAAAACLERECIVHATQVSRTSTEKEINTAYKKLAMKYHPDRTRGDEAAAEKFKEIATAYAVRIGFHAFSPASCSASFLLVCQCLARLVRSIFFCHLAREGFFAEQRATEITVAVPLYYSTCCTGEG